MQLKHKLHKQYIIVQHLSPNMQVFCISNMLNYNSSIQTHTC